ncbi:MAG: hypothetical protein VX223_01720 [Myxococcota bacterium]|nr:hypothetical protein [Myxococcota bacterium]
MAHSKHSPAELRNTAAERILEQLTPFVVVPAMGHAKLDFSPFGLNVPTRYRIDPLRIDNAPFCHQLQQLDGRTFGPEGMPMDRWVFFDCCYMPGAIFGFGRHVDRISDHAREVLGVPESYEGLVPYSMYIAIPMANSGSWMGHNLASISPLLPEENLKSLGTVTKALGLKCFGTQVFFGATQWASKALWVHQKFGPLDIHTAYTPAHSEVQTLTYGFHASDAELLGAMGHPNFGFKRPEPDLWIRSGDVTAMMELQDRIEAGERFVMPTAPKAEGEHLLVPIAGA